MAVLYKFKIKLIFTDSTVTFYSEVSVHMTTHALCRSDLKFGPTMTSLRLWSAITLTLKLEKHTNTVLRQNKKQWMFSLPSPTNGFCAPYGSGV